MTHPSSSWPAAGVHFAWRGEDVVILDVARDRYSCLVAAAAALRPGPAHEGIRITDAELSLDLSRAGLVGSVPTPPRRAPDSAATKAIMAGPRPSAIARARAAGHAAVATADFHRLSFDGLVARARRRRPARRRALSPDAALAAFNAVLPWLPFSGDCLQRGFLLHHHLHREGLAADWVFGVRTWPFLAHCWVETADTVIGDSLERTRRFTPILRL